jgi:hypothetical protein
VRRRAAVDEPGTHPLIFVLNGSRLAAMQASLHHQAQGCRGPGARGGSSASNPAVPNVGSGAAVSQGLYNR